VGGGVDAADECDRSSKPTANEHPIAAIAAMLDRIRRPDTLTESDCTGLLERFP
jgi:hypothetical protein